KEILKETGEYPWHRIYSKDFCVRNKSIEGKSRIQEKEFASKIWNELAKKGISPKVNLDNPKTKIEFIFLGKKVFSIMQVAESRENFAEREPKRRPGFAPVSMSPKLCRAMVNLCSAGKKESITDPFCGTGGIILEAAILGYKTEGFDIDSEMIEKAKENILHFRVKNCKLAVMDASSINRKMNYIACDLPYGLRSMISEKKESLYPKFFSVLKRFLGKRAVIGIQKSRETEKILKALPRNLKIAGRFSQYIHRSLTKEIIVIDKR
ncbi:MAG: methyltransferase domain-containing protein, partial [Candidatus Woesearchaeota archaeon]|nr:methyltransferase domain-containing protein [Candidatus Woesearchaeota archaeon]